MDFELSVRGAAYRFDQFQDLVQMITVLLAQWNNFDPDEPMTILVKKVKNGTTSLEVTVEDKAKADDIFGRP